MLLQERHNELLDAGRQGPVGGPAGQSLDRIRQAGESLLQAADDAIERALSRDSVAFLEETRQDGGQ